MKAIEYIKSVPRWLIVRSGGRKFPFLYTGRLAPVRLTHMPPPAAGAVSASTNTPATSRCLMAHLPIGTRTIP